MREAGDGALVAFLGQFSRFLKPVHVGDTLYLTAVEPGRTSACSGATIHNQERQMVMEGEHRGLQRRKP